MISELTETSKLINFDAVTNNKYKSYEKSFEKKSKKQINRIQAIIVIESWRIRELRKCYKNNFTGLFRRILMILIVLKRTTEPQTTEEDVGQNWNKN